MEITQTINKPVMLSVKETAKEFGIAEHFARQLALSGAVKAVRVGRGKILINCRVYVNISTAAIFPKSRQLRKGFSLSL